MVYFSENFLDGILSTSVDRGLYEALWLVSITKRITPRQNFDAISIENLCNRLIEQWRERDQRSNRFYLSCQLAFGALYVYQFKIDRLYDEAQNTLYSCCAVFCDTNYNWLTEMTQMSSQSTPISSQRNATPKIINLSQKSEAKKRVRSGKAKKQIEPSQKDTKQQIMDDVDAIEQFFKVLEDEPEPTTKNKSKKCEDSGIDPTIINDPKAITMLEPTTMMTSGFQSLELNDIEEAFGTEEGVDFQKIFLESDEVFNSQHQIIASTPNLVSNKIQDIKTNKRRLTYDPIAIADFNVSLQREYQQPELPEIQIHNLQDNAQISVSYEQDIAMQEFPDIPMEPTQMPQFDISEIPQINVKIPKNPMDEEVQPSELILDDVPKAVLQKPRKKPKLIIDKVTYFNKETILKNVDEYKNKHTIQPPRDTFPIRWHELKTKESVLFTSTSKRLKHSEVLRQLFDRNLKKVSERTIKRKITEVEPENPKENENKPMQRKKRPRKTALKDLNEENLINAANIIPEIPEIEMPIVEANIHTESQLPQIEKMPLTLEEDKENRQVRRKVNIDYDGTKLSKKEIMSKLKKLWKKKDQSITMEKLCEGLSRITSAGVFFGLLSLSKEGVIELVQKEGSLEIGDIKCIKSSNQITKLYM